MSKAATAIAALVAVALCVAAWTLLAEDESGVKGIAERAGPLAETSDVTLAGAGPDETARAPERALATASVDPAEDVEPVARPAWRFDVRGRAVDDAGEPVTRFQVELRPHGGGASRVEAFEDPDGAFTLAGVEVGTWYALPSAEGYLPMGLVGVDVLAPEPLELVLYRCGTVSVDVVGPGGEPVPGALVQALSPTYRTALQHVIFDAPEPPSAKTDARGLATISPVRLSVFRVVASAEGLAEGASELTQLSAVQRHAHTRVALTRGGRVEGELRTVDGLPAAGAQLSLYHREAGRSRTASVAADGAFSFERVPAGQHRLSVQPLPEDRDRVPFQSLELEVREGETTIARFRDLASSRVEVVGRLLRDDEPMAGAEIWFHAIGAGGYVGAQFTRSSADGGFALALPASGPYQVEVSGLDGLCAPGSTLRFHADVPAVATYELVLAQRTGTVSGRVLDAAGDPAPRTQVFLTAQGEGWLIHEALTDEDGRYEAVRVPEGTYDVRAQPRAACQPRQSPRAGDTLRAVTVVAGEAVRDLDLRLPAYVSIEGTVVGRDGSPAVSAEIELAGSSGEPASAYSDVSGAFSVTEVEPGDYWLRATWGNDTSAWIRITAPTTDPPRLALEPGARVTVRLAADASPSERLRIDAVDAMGRHGATALLTGRSVELGPLPSGTYGLVASRSSGAAFEEIELTLTAGEERTWILRGED